MQTIMFDHPHEKTTSKFGSSIVKLAILESHYHPMKSHFLQYPTI